LQHEINKMFEEFDRALESDPSGAAGAGMFRPAVDVHEDADAYVVHVELPGVPRDNIDIAMHDGALVIRGRKESVSASGEARFRRVERTYGTFARALQLPRNVDPDRISASLNDGVLEVRLPKHEEVKPRRIAIGDTREVPAKVKPEENITTEPSASA
jgi:HSP20 family protein